MLLNEINVEPGEKYTVTVGKGGSAGKNQRSRYSPGTGSSIITEHGKSGEDGESSQFGDRYAQGGGGGGLAPGRSFGIVREGKEGTSYGEGGTGGIGTKKSSQPTAGQNGWVYIEYTILEKEPLITDTSTIDQSATDKTAPAILELYLNGIPGDKTKYDIAKITEDYGTNYE